MKQLKKIITSIGVGLIAIVLLFPLYWMVITSILPSSVVLSQKPPLLPPLSEVNFDAYKSVLIRAPIFTWLVNSLVITVGSAVLSMVIATLAGYSLSRFRTRGQLAIGFFLLVNRMLPGTLLVIPLFIMFNQAQLLNNPASVMLANITAIVPFTTWMMKGFFDGIPYQLEEAAMVDGCSQLGSMMRVIMPLTAPGLAATSIYSAILAWSDFLFSRTLLTTPEKWTMTIGLTGVV